jgi:cation diffusion facilitator family transporter
VRRQANQPADWTRCQPWIRLSASTCGLGSRKSRLIVTIRCQAHGFCSLSWNEGRRPARQGETVTKAQIERSTLLLLIAINGVMFVIELAAGWVAQSMGLIADSLDMLADAGVYGIALLAVGSSPLRKAQAAAASGCLQLALAGVVLVEVGRKLLCGSEPASGLMIGVSVVALAANAACLYLLRKHRHGEVHMRASWIFSTTDVQANVGVMIAGVLVALTGSPTPDLIIGVLVCGIVVRGGVRILREARREGRLL